MRQKVDLHLNQKPKYFHTAKETSQDLLTCVCVGVEGFTSQEDQEMISRIEKQLKRRFAIGSQVSEHSIVQDFTKQVGVRGKKCSEKKSVLVHERTQTQLLVINVPTFSGDLV